jgi:hypothetical protein
VIANEYSLTDESVKTVSDSHSHESTPHPPEDLARTRLEESSREESPSSTSSGQEPCDSTVVSLDCILTIYHIYICTCTHNWTFTYVTCMCMYMYVYVHVHVP